jgi:hypothetical protein
VRHEKLWKKLYSIGLSSKFIQTVQALYKNAKAKIRTVSGESSYFCMSNGVLQGETLSPKLFSLFIEDIVEILNRSNISSVKVGKADLHILLYADDMVLLAYNLFDLQEKINILRCFFMENDLQVNLGKTKVVIFQQGNRRASKPKIFWGRDEIEIVDKYIYLGVPFYSNMNYSCVGDYFVGKGMQAQKELFYLFYKSKINNIETRICLFECLVKSVLFYCLHVWGVSIFHKIKCFQMQFQRKLFRLPSYIQHWFLTMESQSKYMEISFLKNVLFFWTKIISKPAYSLVRNCRY